jgi:radical SAM superfamily enzyme YgiQ (UPF0313 family)
MSLPLKVLLIQPSTLPSYWGFQESVWFTGARTVLPPIPLITVAAHLPRHWQFRLIDLNVEPLTEDALDWAQVVLLTGMIIHHQSLQEVLARCRAHGVPTVVGGPFVSSNPAAPELAAATSRVIGEIEDAAFLANLIADLEALALKPEYRAPAMPALTGCVVPRFDLLRLSDYLSMAVQVSRGCPHLCEFCNVRVLFGRRPRYKSASQVCAELDALYQAGFRGNIFVVDDNFVGNPKLVGELAEAIAQWQQAHGYPFLFYTEADIRLAQMPELVDRMVQAGFFAVFVGFESPSREALQEANKGQNLRVDPVMAVRELRQRGLLVFGGFIVGFDADGPGCFKATAEFLRVTAIDFAMVGMLIALPGTPLADRLRLEGRLLAESGGDQFELSNIAPARLSRLQLVRGYRRLLQQLYDPDQFFGRARAGLAEWTPRVQRTQSWREIGAVLRSLFWQGVVAPYRLAYWRFLLPFLWQAPAKVPRAFAVAISGHHFFRYTEQVVVPRLLAAEAALASETA